MAGSQSEWPGCECCGELTAAGSTRRSQSIGGDMENFLVLALIAGVFWWLAGAKRRGRARQSKSPGGVFARSDSSPGRAASHVKQNPHASLGLPAEFERLPTEPRTKPRTLTFRQRRVLINAENGSLVIPVASGDRSHIGGGRFYYHQRQTVASLVRAGFLEHTPDGYQISATGSSALHSLPERSN